MEVKLVDHMGTDLSVVNAARVSFAKKHEEFDDARDAKLIRYLAKHGHWTPFGHTSVTIHVKAPIFVARQLAKHQVGLVWNEVSRRYVDDKPEFFEPTVWRQRAENVKQGSSATETVDLAFSAFDKGCQFCGAALTTQRNCEEAVKKFCTSSCQSKAYRQTTDGWIRVKWSRLKQSAAKRGIEFTITPEDLLPLPKYCFYLGVELQYNASELLPESASVNRIDPTLGYTPQNIEIISNKANSMLCNATRDELKLFTKQVQRRLGVFSEASYGVSEYYKGKAELYTRLIELGVCAEQARMLMPQAQQTEWYWTGSIAAWARVCKLRLDPHAQKETQEVARQIDEIVGELFPVSWKELMNHDDKS